MSMEPQCAARTARGEERNVRRKVLNFDLNVLPPRETIEEAYLDEGSSQLQPVQVVGQQTGPSGTGASSSEMRSMVDLERIDVEVIIASPTRFAEASLSRRNRTSEDVPANSVGVVTRVSPNNMRRRVTVIDIENYINLEDIDEKGINSPKPVQSLPPPPPPPTFSCPICLGDLVEEVSTKCGHIFCKGCIKTALESQNNCPTCRRKLTVRGLLRVYLPSAN